MAKAPEESRSFFSNCAGLGIQNFQDLLPMQAENLRKKIIGRLCLDAELFKDARREMTQIQGDNDIGFRLDRSCQDVPVFWVRQFPDNLDCFGP